MRQNTHDVGVIVGRFQIPDLHEAHKDLIQKVCDEHDKVLVILGLSGAGQPTKENPLDYQARKQMIEEAFPQVIVAYIEDKPSDEVWSKELDRVIARLIHANQKPLLYGGRDSFVRHYSGRYDTIELEPEVYVKLSGTEARRKVARSSTEASRAFRAGVTWAVQAQYDFVHATIDVAIFNDDYTKLLLAKKFGESGWRFIGGFVDVKDRSLEQTVRREVAEEAGVEITDPEYIDSFQIDDWRYRLEKSSILTTFFVARKFAGAPNPKDDIDEVKWFDIADTSVVLGKESLMPTHQPLLEATQNYLQIQDRKVI